MDVKPLLTNGRFNKGYCPICESPTIFVEKGDWLRDDYLCVLCSSIPRWRALIEVLETHFPDWRQMRIHECSPGGASSAKLQREGAHYLPTHFFPDASPGSLKDGVRCENLESQTFADASFDLVITQDVLEHLFHPRNAFREIARTLKPGGAHVFTVPWYYRQPTRVRARRQDGEIVHLEPPDYHHNPVDPQGSLVTREWGYDLADAIYTSCGMTTTVIRIRDRSKGIDGEMCEVFISRKIPANHARGW